MARTRLTVSILGGIAALIMCILIVPHDARGAALARGVGADCGIDNNDAVETNVVMSTGEFWNNDYTYDAKLQCRLPSGTAYGLTLGDIDEVNVYVYDYSTIKRVATVLGSHGTGTGVWSSCGYRYSSYGGIGNYTLSWTSLASASCMTTDTTRSIFISVTLPDYASGASRLIGWDVEDGD